MKFDVKTRKIPKVIVSGYVLLYPLGDNFDRGVSIDTIVSRDPVKVVPTHDQEGNFQYLNYDLNSYHLGVFPGKKDEFLGWLKETYQNVPECAQYLFE